MIEEGNDHGNQGKFEWRSLSVNIEIIINQVLVDILVVKGILSKNLWQRSKRFERDGYIGLLIKKTDAKEDNCPEDKPGQTKPDLM